MQNNLNNILAILNQNGGQYIDDHSKQTAVTETAKVIAVHGRHVVMLFPDAAYFSINLLCIRNGQVHLTADSVGGVIDLREMEFDQAVVDYNEAGVEFGRPQLTQVTRIAVA